MENMSIKFAEVLMDYGAEPLVAIAEDSEGIRYLAVAVSDLKYTNPYLVVALSEEMINRVRNGMVDILSAILTPAISEWYVLDLLENPAPMEKIATDPSQIPEKYLPGSDFFLRG